MTTTSTSRRGATIAAALPEPSILRDHAPHLLHVQRQPGRELGADRGPGAGVGAELGAMPTLGCVMDPLGEGEAGRLARLQLTGDLPGRQGETGAAGFEVGLLEGPQPSEQLALRLAAQGPEPRQLPR